jgi:hypothetical protein
MKQKTLLLLVALIFTAFVVKAQIQRGNVLVGAGISNFNYSLTKGHDFSMRIDPKAAWFIRDNFALGAYVTFGLSTAKGVGTKVDYGVGPLARVYVAGDALAAVRHTRLFVEANVGIEGTNNNQTVPKNSTNGLGLGIGPGLAYFITPNIGLEGLIKYQGIIGFGTAVTTSQLNFGVGFQVYLPNRSLRNAATNTQ